MLEVNVVIMLSTKVDAMTFNCQIGSPSAQDTSDQVLIFMVKFTAPHHQFFNEVPIYNYPLRCLNETFNA